MSISVKKNTSFAVEIEDTEGTYKAPTAADSFVQVLADGAEISKSKELLARNTFTASIGKTASRTGQFQVTGSLPVECRAHSTEGDAPEYDALMQSAMGGRRQATTPTTTKTGNTGSVLQIEDADISKFSVGDIVMVKQAGAYHVSPISEVDDSAGTATITLLVAKASGSFSDNVVISKFTTYTVEDSGHPSLSISKYIEGTRLEKAIGCRVSSMSLENFSTGQMPSLNFGFEGLNFDADNTAIPYTPSYDTSFPPIALDARVYMNGTAIDVNELSLSLENALGFQTSVSATNGRVSGRATERTITGSFNPYLSSTDVANYTLYKENTAFSLFAYAKNGTSTPGQHQQVVAVYMPNCIITEIGESDQDGLLQENISFEANRGNGSTPEIYICFI